MTKGDRVGEVGDAFALSEEVGAALREGRPVVGLETSVLAQGLPVPRNLEAAERMGGAIRRRGAVPAWIWLDEGRIRVGFEDETADLERVALSEASKVTRRDLPMAVAGGGLGATTVSATIWASRRAGIDVAATGGIGGVHRGAGDVSADLFEMARTPGALVCSGPKSIVDPEATVERLEELGVGLVGYRCSKLPFFLVEQSALPLEHRADTPEQVAAAVRTRRTLGIESTLLVLNPVPAGEALTAEEVDEAVDECLALAGRSAVTGKLVTPFLLSCVAERTGGASLRANLALLESNAGVAADVAAAVAAP